MHANDYARAAVSIAENDGSAELVAIADEDEARGEAKYREFGAKNLFTDYRKMLEGNLVDAVIIASENSRHLEHVTASAEAGKHIICEKPVCISESEIETMRSSVKSKTGRVFFQTAFVMRYDATVLEVKRKLDSGTLGAIRAISATNHGKFPGGWFGDKELAGGGAIMDHTVHAADLVRFFTADEFACVRAYQGKNIRREIGVEDNAMLYANLKRSGAPVSIDCSWSRLESWPVWGDVTMEIVCEKGLVKLDCFRPHINVGAAGKFSWHGLGEDLSEKMIRAFCQAIEAKAEPHASFEDGAKASLLALAAYRSVADGNQPVNL